MKRCRKTRVPRTGKVSTRASPEAPVLQGILSNTQAIVNDTWEIAGHIPQIVNSLNRQTPSLDYANWYIDQFKNWFKQRSEEAERSRLVGSETKIPCFQIGQRFYRGKLLALTYTWKQKPLSTFILCCPRLVCTCHRQETSYNGVAL